MTGNTNKEAESSLRAAAGAAAPWSAESRGGQAAEAAAGVPAPAEAERAAPEAAAAPGERAPAAETGRARGETLQKPPQVQLSLLSLLCSGFMLSALFWSLVPEGRFPGASVGSFLEVLEVCFLKFRVLTLLFA